MPKKHAAFMLQTSVPTCLKLLTYAKLLRSNRSLRMPLLLARKDYGIIQAVEHCRKYFRPRNVIEVKIRSWVTRQSRAIEPPALRR